MHLSDDLAFMHYLQTGGWPLGYDVKRAPNPRFDEASVPEVYVWRTRGDNRVSSEHAANDGKVFFRDMPHPNTGHPGQPFGCRCVAEPVTLGVLDLPGEALQELEVFTLSNADRMGLPQSVLSELYVVDERDLNQKFLVGLGKVIVRATPALIARLRRQASRTVDAAIEVARRAQVARNWKFRIGRRKDEKFWKRQFEKRGWTRARVTRVILKGERHKAPNKPKGTYDASRYQMGDDFVVLDDQTHELLQISDRTRPFHPEIVP